jgi:hypothetical protein
MKSRGRQLPYLTYLDSSKKSYSHSSNKTQSQKIRIFNSLLSPTINHPEALEYPLQSITIFPRFCPVFEFHQRNQTTAPFQSLLALQVLANTSFFHTLIGFNFLIINSPPDDVFYAVPSYL